MAKLSDIEIQSGLKALPGWERRGDAIGRQFKFGTFAEGIRFVNRVAERADAADHHPDIDIRYTTVTIALSTHSEGGVTRKDLAMAGQIQELSS